MPSFSSMQALVKHAPPRGRGIAGAYKVARGLVVAAVLMVLGCGEKKAPPKSEPSETAMEGETEPSPVRPANTPPKASGSEMLRLSSKRVSRADRPPTMLDADQGQGRLRPEGTDLQVSEDLSSVIPPGEDWESENWSVRALSQLKRAVDQSEDGAVAQVVTSDFRATRLYPNLDTDAVGEVRLGDTTVRRWPSAPLPLEVRGGEALEEALKALLERFEEAPRLEWKSIGIEMKDEDEDVDVDSRGDTAQSFETTVLLDMAGRDARGRRAEMHATWRCAWTLETPPKLRRVAVDSLEAVTRELKAEENSGPWFQDVTASAVASVPLAKEQIAAGIEFWTERITRYGDLYMTGHHGLAVGDVNGDGLEDLYVCDGGSLPNRLYVQQPDGTVRDHSKAAGVDFLEDSRGALLVDLDNDGDQDLVVATVAMIAFAENDGQGRFELRGGHMGAPYPGSVSAADPDNDGDLDLYVCVYEGNHEGGTQGFAARTPIPFHDAQNGGRNVLLENVGDFRFADRTAAFGLETNNQRWSFAAAFEDFDRDGDVDLYVANDFGRNNLYRNDQGVYVDVAESAGVEDMAAGMSVSWGDYNRDGRADLYVGNMYSSAGRRISYQRSFSQKGAVDAAAREGKQRLARGNTLFAGGDSPDSVFEDVSESAGVTMGRWAWSSAFADLNNDGWEDLVVANGYMTNRRDDDL